MSQSYTHLSVRIPTELKKMLTVESQQKNISLSELIKEKIIIATAQNCTLSLNLAGVQIPIEKLAKGAVVLEKTV